MINRKKFFEALAPTPLPRPRTASQVMTLDMILDEAERRKIADLRWLADMMGTALGEVGQRLMPVREGFKITDKEAREYVTRRKYKYARAVNGIVYYGRGLVQVTWYENYVMLTEIARGQGFNVDFVNDPDLLLQHRWAVFAMFEGMVRGTFTKKKLSDYYNDTVTDFVNSRRIINGLDRAAEIGGYKKQFYADLITAEEEE